MVKTHRKTGKNGKIVLGISSNQMVIITWFGRGDVGLLPQGQPSVNDILSFWTHKIKEGSTLVHDNFLGHGLLIKELKLGDKKYPTSKKGLNQKELERANKPLSSVKGYFYCHTATLNSHILWYLSMT